MCVFCVRNKIKIKAEQIDHTTVPGRSPFHLVGNQHRSCHIECSLSLLGEAGTSADMKTGR